MLPLFFSCWVDKSARLAYFTKLVVLLRREQEHQVVQLSRFTPDKVHQAFYSLR
jgi:hypothetical protein